MKKTFANRSLSLLTGFFLFGILLLTAGRVSAQDTVNWKDPADAQLAIENGMQAYKDDATNGVGQIQNNAKAHVYYFRAIYSRISEGSTVVNAVISCLDIFKDPSSGFATNGDALDVTVTKAYKDVLYQDAVALLKK